MTTPSYYVYDSDHCPGERTAPYQCGDDLNYCVDAAYNEWRSIHGEHSFSVCEGEKRIVAFNPTWIPDEVKT